MTVPTAQCRTTTAPVDPVVPGRRVIPAHAGLPGWLPGHHPLSLAVAGLSVVLATAIFLDAPLYRLREALDPAVQEVFRRVTRVGNAGWSILLAGGLCFWFGRLARSAPRARDALRWRQAAGQAAFLLSTMVVSGVLANLLKWGLGRARPSVAGAEGPFDFGPIATSAGWASFPSGHATTIMALAVGAGFLLPRLRLAFVAVALWIAFSRVIVGAHWASDVVAGIALGAVTAVALRRWFARRGRVFVWRNGQLQPRTTRLVPFLRRKTALAARRAVAAGLSAAKRAVAAVAGPPAPKAD